MSEPVTVRRIAAHQVDGLIDALADVLMDCVEGGASVSFMLPITRATAVRFWRGVADDVARSERVLLVAETGAARIVGTVQLDLEPAWDGAWSRPPQICSTTCCPNLKWSHDLGNQCFVMLLRSSNSASSRLACDRSCSCLRQSR
jgi:hypothetical protein